MKKILVFSDGEKLGDGIIKIPFINDLKKEIPKSSIYWLTNGNTVYSNVLKPFVSNKLDFIIDNANLNFLPFFKITSRYEFNDIKFDLIIDTQKTFIKTLSLKKINTKVFLSSCASGIFSNPKKYIKLENDKERYYLDNIYNLLEIYLNKRIEKRSPIEYPQKTIGFLSHYFKSNKKYFGVAPGAGESKKIWDTKNYIRLVEIFKKRGYEPCFFLCPEDKIIRDHLINYYGVILEPERKFPNLPNIECIMAMTNFLEFAISNDSGVSHILSTGNTILFKIFNDKIPSKFTKINSKIHTISPPPGKKINDISVQQVYEKITQNINDKSFDF